jgi:hypothetical protein
VTIRQNFQFCFGAAAFFSRREDEVARDLGERGAGLLARLASNNAKITGRKVFD